MKMQKLFLAFAALALVGAGCLSTAPADTLPPQDATPGVNEDNCTRSGGSVQGDACVCPEGFMDDPAGFCLDAQGRPGGAMAR